MGLVLILHINLIHMLYRREINFFINISLLIWFSIILKDWLIYCI